MIHIETIGKSRQDGSLSNTIGHAEGRRELVVPSDVCKLVDVNENEQSDKDCRESCLQEFLEENGVLYKIKSFTHIHHATEHIPTIPQEVADRLNNSPGAHVRGDPWLVGKLKVVNAKLSSKEDEDDPVKKLQNKATDRNCSIILT